jgi:hypothetical protein
VTPRRSPQVPGAASVTSCGNGYKLRLVICPICGADLEPADGETRGTGPAYHLSTHDWQDLIAARRRAGLPQRLTPLEPDRPTAPTPTATHPDRPPASPTSRSD